MADRSDSVTSETALFMKPAAIAGFLPLPTWTSWKPASASSLLWLGVLLGLAGWILAVLAIVFGSIGLARAKVQSSFGQALTALILGTGLLPVPLVVLALVAAVTATG